MKNVVVRKSYPYGVYDPFFDAFFNTGTKEHEVMKTDIIEEEDHYLLKVNVPDIQKENIKLSLKDGYLSIEAKFDSTSEEENHKNYIRRERYYGSYSRSFYVGEDVEQKDISAKLENGVLNLKVMKVEAKPKEESTNIEIL